MLKPYYEDEWVTIYHGDCREILPELPKVDLVLTDPPYGINYNPEDWDKANKAMGNTGMKSLDKIIGDDKPNDWSFLFQYHNRIIFGFPYIYDASASGWLVWDKRTGLGTPIEMASSTVWKGFRLLRCLWSGSFMENESMEVRTIHPTQKPQKVMEYLIGYSAINDLILDPFLGSGTTAYCAKKLNRKCIGIEIKEKYCEIAAKRCSQGVFDFGFR